MSKINIWVYCGRPHGDPEDKKKLELRRLIKSLSVYPKGEGSEDYQIDLQIYPHFLSAQEAFRRMDDSGQYTPTLFLTDHFRRDGTQRDKLVLWEEFQSLGFEISELSRIPQTGCMQCEFTLYRVSPLPANERKKYRPVGRIGEEPCYKKLISFLSRPLQPRAA